MKKLLFSAAVLAVTALQAQDCTDLFFSEYVEGSSQNKALEIYNPTGATIDLSTYKIKRYKNGQTLPDTELQLSGNIASFDVVVISNGQIVANSFGAVDSALYFYADINGTGDHSTSPMYFNGNDALTIEKAGSGASDDIVDIFGKVGQDPDQGWNDDAATGYQTTDFWKSWTKDHTMVRKASVKKGVVVNPTEFNTSLEYDSLPENTFSDLGRHLCDCGNTPTSSWEPLSVSEHNDFSFIAYSIEGSIVVSSQENLTNMEVIDLSGKLVYSEAVSGGSFTVNSNVNVGVYILRLTNDNGVQSSSKIFLK